MTKERTEILAPAGSYESLKTAIAAGADAVYIGGSLFGARAFADNPEEDVLLQAIDYVHLHGKKIYLTVNTLLKEQELSDQLYEYLLPYYQQGLDAVIVQDVGVLRFVKQHFPNMAIHASTQMTITNTYGARFLKQLGAERVVTARELQLSEVAEIVKQTGMEIESFVHGALCYCYSGQCLLSSMIGGRSGNRGQCAQPCRLLYQTERGKKPEYLMSLKDICTLDLLPKLIQSGIYSFKIEGRMKKPEYVAAVTSMYRKYTDLYLERGEKGYRVLPEDKQMLMDIYNRGGFHSGYYQMRNGREMLSLTRPNHAGVQAVKVEKIQGNRIIGKALTKLHPGDVIEIGREKENFTMADSVLEGNTVSLTTHRNHAVKKNTVLNRVRNTALIEEFRKNYVDTKIKEKINGILILSTTNSVTLKVEKNGIVAEVYGKPAEKAQTQPMTIDRIKKQMCKTGTTPFVFETLEIQMEEDLFVPVQALNELRREALEELECRLCGSYRRETPQKLDESLERYERYSAEEYRLRMYALAETREQFDVLCREQGIERIYLESFAVSDIFDNKEIKKLTQLAHEMGKELFLAMPHIFRSNTVQRYEENYAAFTEAGFDGVLIRNYESFAFLQMHGYKETVVTDHNLYRFNREADKFWRELGIREGTAPLELNAGELRKLGIHDKELIVYGYIPVMLSAQCIQKTTGGCRKKSGILTLTDRCQKQFQVRNNCEDCYNIVYNTAPLVLTDQREEIENLAPGAIRMMFTRENASQVKACVERYRKVFLEQGEISNVTGEFTRGHFKRGIK